MVNGGVGVRRWALNQQFYGQKFSSDGDAIRQGRERKLRRNRRDPGKNSADVLKLFLRKNLTISLNCATYCSMVTRLEFTDAGEVNSQFVRASFYGSLGSMPNCGYRY